MSTLGSTVYTLPDLAKTLDPNGAPARIIELLNQTNDVLTDMMWKEGNLPTGHRTTVRTGLPTVAWRLINNGVAPSKATTAQVDEACGILEAWSEVDEILVNLNGNNASFRMQNAKAYLEAMNQEFVQTLFYGNSGTSPEEFTGLMQRYNSTTATSGQNVLSGSGSDSDLSSVWLIVWGEDTVCGIYPKGSQAGLRHQDWGKSVVETSSGIGGNRMAAYLDQWQWHCGIALLDWRYAVRICNIDISNLVAKSSAADLPELMIKAVHRLPGGASGTRRGKAAFYMNRTCFEMLDIQRRDDVISGGGLNYMNVDGVAQPYFRGIPVRIVDQLLQTESTVS